MPNQTLAQALCEPELAEPCLVLEAAGSCKILNANPAWCALTGFSDKEAVGHPVSLIHGSLTCRETLTALGLAMSGECLQRVPSTPLPFVRACATQCGRIASARSRALARAARADACLCTAKLLCSCTVRLAQRVARRRLSSPFSRAVPSASDA